MSMTSLRGWLVNTSGAHVLSGPQALLTGPIGRILVTREGFIADGVSKIRPCDIVVDEAYVLRRSFSLPVEAMRELRSAIGLQIEASTPFSAKELVLGVHVSAIDQDLGHRRVDVAAVPLLLLNQAREAVNVRVQQVRKVTTAAAPYRSLAFPKRSWNWTTLLSAMVLAILAFSWILSGTFQLRASQEVAAELRTTLEEVQFRARELVEEVDRRAMAAAAMISGGEQFSSAVPSATAALLALSSARPSSAEVLRIALRSDGMLVALRSPDVMTAVGEFQKALPEWDVILDGGITVDAATDSEISAALFRLRP